jgi:hypothetical protein
MGNWQQLPSLEGNWELLQAEVWGKTHMELRVDTQFVRFSFTGYPRPLTLNNIQTDRKELKMLTKGLVRKWLSYRRRL